MEQTLYNPVTPEIVRRLREIAGEKYVIADAEKLEPFSHDEVVDRRYAHMPEVLVRPADAQQIAAIVTLANEEKIPLTPRGAGSGLSGGAVPICGGIVMLCDRMNRIIEIDTRNMVIVVEPGVITSDINAALEGTGLFYAGYPMSMETCFIGGNVAENAGGGKAVKYGVTSRYVLGLEVVTPTGKIVQFGGKLIKDVTGYNMIQLMLGSEGTLGIFTKIILRLMPKPPVNADLLVMFESAQQAIAAVPMLMTNSGVIPTAIEFMDRSAVQTACRYLNETIPYERAEAMLIVTLDGNSQEQVECDYDAVGQLCRNAGAYEIFVADNYTTSERIWKIRRVIAEAFAVFSSPWQLNEDLVVPPAAICELVDVLRDISQKYDVYAPCYGHAGDGNIHTRISPKNISMTRDDWYTLQPALLGELYTRTAALGGKLSGEHGIGHKRKAYMKYFLSPAEIASMLAIKRALDPNNILNPGKIFDTE